METFVSLGRDVRVKLLRSAGHRLDLVGRLVDGHRVGGMS